MINEDRTILIMISVTGLCLIGLIMTLSLGNAAIVETGIYISISAAAIGLGMLASVKRWVRKAKKTGQN